MSDFIEYPFLAKPPPDWRNKPDESVSDCTIILQSSSGTPSECIRKYFVHLRVLGVSSDYFYRIPMMNLQNQLTVSSNICDCSDSCDGDINIKLQDGTCSRMGSMGQPLSELRKQIQERCGIPIFEQRLIPSNADDPCGSQMQDWRSLAACGFKKGDTLLLVQEPWQQYDPSTKTLVLRLPEICIRCLSAANRFVAHEMHGVNTAISAGPLKPCWTACTALAASETLSVAWPRACRRTKLSGCSGWLVAWKLRSCSRQRPRDWTPSTQASEAGDLSSRGLCRERNRFLELLCSVWLVGKGLSLSHPFDPVLPPSGHETLENSRFFVNLLSFPPFCPRSPSQLSRDT